MNLLEQERQQSEDQTVIHQSLSKHEKNTKITTDSQIQKETFSENLSNEMYLEAQELMKNSHWLTNVTEKDMKNDFDSLAASRKYEDLASITDLQYSSGS